MIRKLIEPSARMLSNCTIVVLRYPRCIAPTFVFIPPARDAHVHISSPPHIIVNAECRLFFACVRALVARARSSFRPKTIGISLRFASAVSAAPSHLSFVESRSIFVTAMHTKDTKGSSTLRRMKMNVCLGLLVCQLFHNFSNAE